MKALKILLVLVLVVVIVLVAGAVYLNHYVQSPAFKETVLATAKESLGAEVALTEMQVSLLSGVTLRGVKLANPAGFDGDLLSADAFVLRYRLMPLLQKRIEIEELALEKPVLTLVRNEQEEWNYEKLGGAPSSDGGTAPSTSSGSMPLDVTLSSLALNNGDVLVRSGSKSLLEIRGIAFSSAVNMTAGKLTGSGNARIATINVANSLFVKQVATPVTIATDAIRLNPLSGACAGGTISGEAGLVLTPAFKYTADVKLADSDLSTLLQEAGVSKKVLNGKLQLTCKLEGTGGVPTLSGNGKAEITGGQLVDIPTLNLLAALLQVSELRDLKFDECLMEFTVANNQMQTPVIRLVAPQVQITGKGTVSLADYSLDHHLTLALAAGLLGNVPKEVRAVFTDRGDGFFTLDFRVYGPYDAPKTDLKERLVKGATDQLLQKGLEKLFK